MTDAERAEILERIRQDRLRRGGHVVYDSRAVVRYVVAEMRLVGVEVTVDVAGKITAIDGVPVCDGARRT